MCIFSYLEIVLALSWPCFDPSLPLPLKAAVEDYASSYRKLAPLADFVASDGEKKFNALDYMTKTPAWAVFGCKEQGFDPEETRFRRKGKNKDLSGC